PRSVLEVVELICHLAGTDVEPDVRGTGTPAGEISRQWVDSGKLRAAAGWEPRIGLEDGLRRTIAWYREHLLMPQSARARADHRRQMPSSFSITGPLAGGAAQALRCFEAIAAQPADPAHEIIVVDDASADLEPLLTRLQGDVDVFRTERRLGFA